MDLLSNHKDEIICHEKVVRIPILDGKVLRVLGERLKEEARHLMSAKEQKQEEMEKLCNAPVLALPNGPEDFVVYCDTSGLGLACELMQIGKITVVILVRDRCPCGKGGDVVDLNGDEDGDTGMGDLTGVLVSLGGEIFSKEKKSRESNISGSDNTGDRGKTAGRAIIAWGGGIASYACMIYGSL
nr:putative reverse transcriptase domain-containing protein [Tanacetum cinerariifolium]